MSECVIVYDLEHFIKVDKAALVHINPVEAVLESLFFPFLLRICLRHKLLEESATLVDVQVAIVIFISLREYSSYARFKLL